MSRSSLSRLIFALVLFVWLSPAQPVHAQPEAGGGMTQLLNAVEHRQVDRVRAILDQGVVDLNAPNSTGSYVLDWSLRRYAVVDSELYVDDLAIFKMLIEAGARVWGWSRRYPQHDELTYAQLWAMRLMSNPWGDLGIDKFQFLVEHVLGEQALLWEKNERGDDFLMWFCREGLFPTFGTNARSISWYQGLEMTHRPGTSRHSEWTPEKLWEFILASAAGHVGSHIILIPDLERADEYINDHLARAGANGCPLVQGDYPVER